MGTDLEERASTPGKDSHFTSTPYKQALNVTHSYNQKPELEVHHSSPGLQTLQPYLHSTQISASTGTTLSLYYLLQT